MNLRGMVVCVNYSDLLARSIDRWHVGLDRLLVVTDTKDQATHELCRKHSIEVYKTDIFYANGAKFNKGAALSEAAVATRYRHYADWLMTFDADIVPPVNWRSEVVRQNLQFGKLYGASRYWVPEHSSEFVVHPHRKMPQGWVLGFFMIFHSQDCYAKHDPLFDMFWPHAGCYDTTFCRRWPKGDQVILPIQTIHLGEERTHWAGRGKSHVLNSEFLQHRRGYEDWEREKMLNPPSLLNPKESL